MFMSEAFLIDLIFVSKMSWKRCSVSHAIGELQIKTTVGHHHAPVRVAKIHVTDPPNVSEDVGRPALAHAGGNVPRPAAGGGSWQLPYKTHRVVQPLRFLAFTQRT